MKESNVFDPISEHLDENLFNGINPKPEVVKFIEKTIIGKLNKHYDFDVSKYINLYWTGSTTTYQYSKTADIDIHIFVNYIKWPIKINHNRTRNKLIHIVIEEINDIKIPNTEHPLQAFIIAEGVEPMDNFDVGLRSAWSFSKKKWLIKPEKDRTINVLNDTTEIYAKAMRISEQMDILLEENPAEAYKLYKKLWRKRQKGQKIYGDFSEENIIYKFLEHSGQFDKVKRLHEKISSILKEASWQDIEQKAKKYVEEGHFFNEEDPTQPILNNGYYIEAMCQGEENMEKTRIPQTGLYRVQIWKDFPGSRAITRWACTCPWGQVSWGRTRQWSRYEGRPCAHVLGLYWITQGIPPEYRQELNQMVQQLSEEEVNEITQREQQADDRPFRSNDIVRIKPGNYLPIIDPNTGETTTTLNPGTKGVVVDYDSARNQIYVSFDNAQGGYFDPSTLPLAAYDANLFYKPQKKRASLIIKEALYVPNIYQVT